MVLHLVLCGKCNKTPITRQYLLKALRQHSPRSYHATRSYLWTEENLFTSLTPLVLTDLNFDRNMYYAFRADMFCGGNNDDIRVAVMILLDLTSAVDDLVALATEDDDDDSCKLTSKIKENYESSVVLVELADVLDRSKKNRKAYLRRWSVDEDNYHHAMAQRVMLMAGSVYALPHSLQCLFPTSQVNVRLLLTLLSMNEETRERCYEAALTEALHVWSNNVARVMREESWHLVVVAVPASVAELLDAHPQLFQTALLYHAIRHPLTWHVNDKEESAFFNRTGYFVHGVIQEYRTLLRNRRYVRLPLRMPRYVFAHFFHTGFPPSLRTEPLVQKQSPLMQQPVADSAIDVVVDEQELLLGLQLTIALHRLRLEDQGPHKDVIERFLDKVQRDGEAEAGVVMSSESMDLFANARLNHLRRKMMPVKSLRSSSIDWMYACAREAAIECTVTERELFRLEELVLTHSDSSTTVSSEEEECESRSTRGDEDDYVGHYDSDFCVSRQLEEAEYLLDTRMREAVLGDCGTEEVALREVADNNFFCNTLKMLASNDISEN